MLSRTTTVVNTVAITILALPIVWAIGYQDHPWRHAAGAYLVSLALVAAAHAVSYAGRAERPPVDARLRRAAVGVAYLSVLCAVFWAWMST